MARHKIRPHVQGELIACDLPNTKCSPAEHPRRSLNAAKIQRSPRDRSWPGAGGGEPGFGRSARCQLVRKKAGNDGSRAYATFEISFSQKLSVRIQHGKPRNSNLGRQGSAGWNSLPRAQVATGNRRAVAVVNLPMQRLRSGPIHPNDRHDSRCCPLHGAIIMVMS